jgi:cell division protein FtsA
VARDSIVVGLDIGTTKVACVVGERRPAGGIDIIGVGTAPSTGLRKGVVIHIEDTVNSIHKALEEAELMAGVEINTVYAGIAGGHIRSMNSQGMVGVKTGHVSQADVDKVLDTAQALAIPMDRELIHVIPAEYVVDDQEGIADPRGMSGVRLTARVHIVTAAVTATQNIVHCCNLTGQTVREVVLEPLASAEAVLTHDEKQLGVMLIDIGGGTTDVAVYVNGAVVHTWVLPVGGDHVTKDIAHAMRAPLKVAEDIKQQRGCALRDLVEDEASFDVPHVGGARVHETTQRMIAEVIEPRCEEIFQLVRAELERAGCEDLLSAGVVLTGGSTLLPGMPQLAERVLGLSARRGAPRDIGGLADVVASPTFSTAVGLVKYGFSRQQAQSKSGAREQGLVRSMRDKAWVWIKKAL